MADKVIFALREFCEVYSLKTIIEYCRQSGLAFQWSALALPVNTDFDYCGLSKAFSDTPEVTVVEHFDEAFLSSVRPFGFTTDKSHESDGYMRAQFSSQEIASCKRNSRPHNRTIRPSVVAGNVKVKSPVEAFQSEIFLRLATLPYDVTVVPRHPLSSDEMAHVSIPSPIRFINTMGGLESLHARASLTIMGRILSADGLVPDDDHNPIEATINSNAICGIIKEIPKPYEWLYEESGLIHQCSTLDEVYEEVGRWICDPAVAEKLARKDDWIRSNRIRYLGKIVKALQS